MANQPEHFPIAAIGASAGGIEALKILLSALPPDAGVAYLILLHMSADPNSKIVEVLGGHIKVAIKLAETGMTIERDTVYVSPPGFDLTVQGGALIVEPRDESQHPQRPIDNLFESLARDARECAICVVLSGTGTNGTAGLRLAKAEGALIIAQDPATARFPGMPRNAIASDMVDFILSPEEIPQALIDYSRHPYLKFDNMVESPTMAADQQLTSVLALLRTRSNHDFRGYKKRTLTRRIVRRMGLRRLDRMEDYLNILRTDPDEVHALVGDLLISVTGFFRDGEAWEELRQLVLRPLIEERHPDLPIRVWVPACATGEEAYTVAMVLMEECRAAQKRFDVKVFATDPSASGLATARAAVYPASAVAAMPPERVLRFFEEIGDSYKIKKELRELVIFAPQDLLADPPFSRLDLITCRNLLIYLEPSVQKRLLSLFHFALQESGALFLGNAETINGTESLFKTLSKKWRIFRRIGAARRDFSSFTVGRLDRHTGSTPVTTPPARQFEKAADHAQRLLIDEFAPPSVLIDEHYRVLYYHGDTDPFLRQPPGEPTSDLLLLLREGLRAKVRAAIQSVMKEGGRTQFKGRVKQQNGYVNAQVSVIQTTGTNHERHTLVSFTPLLEQAQVANQNSGQPTNELIVTEHDVEEELRSVREELRSTIEQLESSNEELKAANEEVTSMNEELQSTNEELETSKEELQSLNEELNTVNSQLLNKVDELEDKTNDLNNLFNSSDIATLFLDTNFTIRWFTPAMRGLLDVLPTDIGRPISNLALKFKDDAFLANAERVLKTLIPDSAEVSTDEGRWYMRRILPYRTENNRIDGVVVTFTDITERRKGEEDLRHERDFGARIIDTLQESLLVLDPEMRIKSANRAFYETFKLQRGEVEGRSLFEIDHREWDISQLRQVLSPNMPIERTMHKVLVQHQSSKLGRRALSINIRSLELGRLILLVIEDVTDAQNNERRQDILLAELQHRVKNILASVQAIARMTHQRSTTLEEFWDSFQGRLIALATTQELLTRAKMERVSLTELVEQELTAQGARSENFRIDGPDLSLTAKAAQNIALALHELTTNAAKHGALSQPEGFVDVTWRNENDQIRFEWTETGGPPVIKPARRGFGTELIEKAIPYQLRGKTKLDYKPEGLRCTFEFGVPGNIVSYEAPDVFSPTDGDENQA